MPPSRRTTRVPRMAAWVPPANPLRSSITTHPDSRNTLMKRTSFALALCGLLPLPSTATENLPRIPFAESARLPEPNQWVVTPWYNYSVFRKFWIGDTKTSIEMKPKDDFEVNDGMLRLDYGLSR